MLGKFIHVFVGWSCQTGTHGFHNGHRVPPKTIRNNSSYFRIKGTRQTPSRSALSLFCDINESIEKSNTWVKHTAANLVWCKRLGCFEVDPKALFNANSWSRIIGACFVALPHDLIIVILFSLKNFLDLRQKADTGDTETKLVLNLLKFYFW